MTALVDDYGLSISVKAHEMFFHVAPWLKKWNIPLGVVPVHTLKNPSTLISGTLLNEKAFKIQILLISLRIFETLLQRAMLHISKKVNSNNNNKNLNMPMAVTSPHKKCECVFF